MKTPSVRALFLAFLTVGLSGFGGVLPFARRMLVERRQWLTETDFNETLALCQSLPGPNIVNMSVVVGSRFAGPKGALACLTGLVVAPVALVLVLADLWGRFGAVGHVPGAIRGLAAAAAGLAAATTLKMARPILIQSPFSAGPIVAAAFVAVGLLRLPLPWVALTLAPVSVLIAWRRGR
ncbi:MAG TPA: chromate transporter [Caulobacteraceae bacterium]|nr:chromate transporter [Caulobacteraceae bacterium]